MEAIRRCVEIPANRLLKIDFPLPEDIPPGPAEIILVISPHASLSQKKGFLSHAGALADSRLFSKGGMAIQEELRGEW